MDGRDRLVLESRSELLAAARLLCAEAGAPILDVRLQQPRLLNGRKRAGAYCAVHITTTEGGVEGEHGVGGISQLYAHGAATLGPQKVAVIVGGEHQRDRRDKPVCNPQLAEKAWDEGQRARLLPNGQVMCAQERAIIRIRAQSLAKKHRGRRVVARRSNGPICWECWLIGHRTEKCNWCKHCLDFHGKDKKAQAECKKRSEARKIAATSAWRKKVMGEPVDGVSYRDAVAGPGGRQDGVQPDGAPLQASTSGAPGGTGRPAGGSQPAGLDGSAVPPRQDSTTVAGGKSTAIVSMEEVLERTQLAMQKTMATALKAAVGPLIQQMSRMQAGQESIASRLRKLEGKTADEEAGAAESKPPSRQAEGDDKTAPGPSLEESEQHPLPSHDGEASSEGARQRMSETLRVPDEDVLTRREIENAVWTAPVEMCQYSDGHSFFRETVVTYIMLTTTGASMIRRYQTTTGWQKSVFRPLRQLSATMAMGEMHMPGLAAKLWPKETQRHHVEFQKSLRTTVMRALGAIGMSRINSDGVEEIEQGIRDTVDGQVPRLAGNTPFVNFTGSIVNLFNLRDLWTMACLARKQRSEDASLPREQEQASANARGAPTPGSRTYMWHAGSKVPGKMQLVVQEVFKVGKRHLVTIANSMGTHVVPWPWECCVNQEHADVLWAQQEADEEMDSVSRSPPRRGRSVATPPPLQRQSWPYSDLGIGRREGSRSRESRGETNYMSRRYLLRERTVNPRRAAVEGGGVSGW